MWDRGNCCLHCWITTNANENGSFAVWAEIFTIDEMFKCYIHVRHISLLNSKFPKLIITIFNKCWGIFCFRNFNYNLYKQYLQALEWHPLSCGELDLEWDLLWSRHHFTESAHRDTDMCPRPPTRLDFGPLISLNFEPSTNLEAYMCLFCGWGENGKLNWDQTLKDTFAVFQTLVKNYMEVKFGGTKSNCHRGGFHPPAGLFHSEIRRTAVFFLLAVISSQTEGRLALEIHLTLIRGNSQPLMEAIKQYRSHIIRLANRHGSTCRSAGSSATPCRRFNHN